MASADLDLSVLQMRRNLTDLMESAGADTGPDSELILRSRRDQAMASDRAVRAVRTVVSRQDVDDGLVERVWRDVQTARTHVASNVEQVLSIVGRFAYGLNVDDIMW